MSGTVTLTRDGELAVARLSRPHGNAINPELVADMRRCLTEAAADDDVRGLLLAASGKLFCPGLDLPELVELDRVGMAGFVDAFRAMVHELYSFPKPMVAALSGHAVAGGCVLGLTADWRVLVEGAKVGLNEVKVGVPFPYGVALILRESVSPRHLTEVALFGRNWSGDEAVAAGLAHEVHAQAGFEDHCLARLRELADKDPGAFAVTKRYLRGGVLERIRAHEDAKIGDFLDAWFSESTRRRVREVVASLRR